MKTVPERSVYDMLASLHSALVEAAGSLDRLAKLKGVDNRLVRALRAHTEEVRALACQAVTEALTGTEERTAAKLSLRAAHAS